jgi:hypothetical protein
VENQTVDIATYSARDIGSHQRGENKLLSKDYRRIDQDRTKKVKETWDPFLCVIRRDRMIPEPIGDLPEEYLRQSVRQVVIPIRR